MSLFELLKTSLESVGPKKPVVSKVDLFLDGVPDLYVRLLDFASRRRFQAMIDDSDNWISERNCHLSFLFGVCTKEGTPYCEERADRITSKGTDWSPEAWALVRSVHPAVLSDITWEFLRINGFIKPSRVDLAKNLEGAEISKTNSELPQASE